MINYIFVKAINLAGVALIYPAMLVPATNKTFSQKDVYLLSSFSASTKKLNVSIGNNVMVAMDEHENNYVVRGAMKDGRFAWDLQYERMNQVKPVCLSNQTSVGIGQALSWISYAPSLHVKGSMTLDNQKYDIEGFGEVCN